MKVARFVPEITIGFGICALSVALLLANEPQAFGAGAPRRTPPPRRTAATIAANPFSWPRDVPPPARAASGARGGSPGGGDVLHPHGLVVYAGDKPFAVLPDRADPIIPGSSYAGSVVKDITAQGLLLDDGRIVSADQANYDTVANQAIPGATIPPITPDDASAPTPTPIPERETRPTPAPRDAFQVYPTMKPFILHPSPSPHGSQ